MDEILDELRELRDPWASMPAPIPYFLFGSGARRPFSAYFDGPSRVSVSSIFELERWLHTCSYVSAKTLFGRDDYWQLPGEFELIRMGDCDDHALWAWRKFVELGHEASLVVGRWRGDSDELHVWLLLSMGGEQLIYEATSKVLGEALRQGRLLPTRRPCWWVTSRTTTGTVSPSPPRCGSSVRGAATRW